MGKGPAHRFKDDTKLVVDWQVVCEGDSMAERFIESLPKERNEAWTMIAEEPFKPSALNP